MRHQLSSIFPFAPASSITACLYLWFVLANSAEGLAETNDALDYNRDVRPILSDHCYQCHGPDENTRPTELRLDRQDDAFAELDSGIRAIVPSDIEQSAIIGRVTSTDESILMPPPEAGEPLTPSEVATLKRWIREGATWGQHWSFVSPKRPQVPQVRDRVWLENAIDAFILQALERKAWQPAPRADKNTLIRRASFAATGLPPSREALQQFLADTSPDAYEQLVDRLLDSPSYGEHQARYWLDLARYGDTHGLHLDNERTIWRYRDWVIDAFNRNMPFDQFTIEQLAGDLLPNSTLDQKIATGFHRCNVTTSEGGAIAEEFLTRYAVDRTETTSAVWLGLTTGCAACHDHKFDPISQKEFYQLYAYFYNLTEKAMDGNAKLPPPSIKAPTELQRIQQEALSVAKQRVEASRDQILEELRSDRTWETTLSKSLGEPVFAPQDAIFSRSMNGTKSISADRTIGTPQAVPGYSDKSIAFDGNTHFEFDDVASFDRTDRFSFAAWVRIQRDGALTVLSRMNDDANYRGYDLYLAGRKVFVHLLHRWPDNALRVNTRLPLRKEKWQHVTATYDGSGKAAGVTIYVDGVEQELERTHDALTGSIETEEPFRIGKRKRAATYHGEIDELLVFDRCLTAAEVRAITQQNALAEFLAIAPENRSVDQDRSVLQAYLQTLPRARAVLQELAKLEKEIAGLDREIPSTLIMEDREERRTAHVLVRGEYDKKGDAVQPNVPAVLPSSKDEVQNRLALARWLVDKRHPLTARVTVNRIWQQHFGTGLVKTAEDFGSQGEWPSHPELLDYLATELVSNGWNLKSLHRQILLSATFQQSSRISPRARREDPENRLLSHGPRFRMDAEMIRDLAMSASGLLVRTQGGPSVKPYQPVGLWKAVGYTSSNTANFRKDDGANLYRRGIYTYWKRTSPPPQMQVLDAPSREVCTVRRPRTNTPGAALLLMNDVQFVEAARKLAERIISEQATDQEKIQAIYEILLSRKPSKTEGETISELIRNMRENFGHAPAQALELLSVGDSKYSSGQPEELAAWTIACSTIMNLDETINQR